MAPENPPELPKLPPIRESAEQAFPADTEDAAEPETRSAWIDAEDSVPAPDSAAARAEARRASRKRTGTRPAAGVVEPDVAAPPPNDKSPYSDDGRRLGTAGHGLVVALLALVFGALLLAPGMHKAAFNGQPGTKRDVALALTSGLDHVSHALLLDRPRGLVQDAMGRDNADEIDVAIVVPPTPVNQKPGGNPSPKPTKPVVATPTKPAFTPKKKLRLWIAGDSLVIVPGYSIVRAAIASPVIQSVGGVDGHVATGLTRPDVFNWFQELATQVKTLHPNVVVMNFGANDNHSYMTGLPEGTSIGSFASPVWEKEYRRRVGAVMDTVNRAGGVVVWIGLPVTRSETEAQEFDQINAIVLKEAKKRPGKVVYIDTYTMFAGDNGGFSEYLQNDRGDTIKVRAGDGVHFDPAGGDIIARKVLKQLNTIFDLTSWKKRKPS